MKFENGIKGLITIIVLALCSSCPVLADDQAYGTVNVTRTSLSGIGQEEGVMRRDPSDVIKVGDLYYVWYSKGKSILAAQGVCYRAYNALI